MQSDQEPQAATPDDLALLRSDFPVSHRLLLHDGLMTGQLIAAFGPVIARQIRIEEDARILNRWSELLQQTTGRPILSARLAIRKSALPPGFLDELLATDRLFGALLVDFGVEVTLSARRICRSGSAQGGIRWGRSQVMTLAGRNEVLCEVNELLVQEAALHQIALADRGAPVLRDPTA